MITLGSLGKFENIGVDKKIVEGEQRVTLLNFVDIFNHKHIDSSIPSMVVTASAKKIKLCDVRRGDVFVTPSSETPEDIGHSAVILEDLDNTVYSYHIMRYRLNEPDMLASFYINYLFDTESVKKQIQKKAKGLTRFGLSKDAFASIEIPFPSIEKQESFVHKLDAFNALITKLDEEIELRKQQFVFYRHHLLNLNREEGVKMKVKDFCLLKAGKSIKAENIGTESDDNNYPCFGGNGIRGYVSIFSHDGNYPIIGRQGALCGCVNWAKGKFYATEHAVVASGKEKMNQRFLFHLFQHADLNQYKTQGAQPGLSVAKLNELIFMIPKLQKQIEIATALDTFSTLISKLEEERDLRKKQYEYYREKILTFE